MTETMIDLPSEYGGEWGHVQEVPPADQGVHLPS